MKKILIFLAIVLSISACAVYTPFGGFYTPPVVYGGGYDYYGGPGYGYYGDYYRPWHGYYGGYYRGYYDGYHGGRYYGR